MSKPRFSKLRLFGRGGDAWWALNVFFEGGNHKTFALRVWASGTIDVFTANGWQNLLSAEDATFALAAKILRTSDVI